MYCCLTCIFPFNRPGTAFSQYGGYLTPHGQAGIPIGMPTSLNQSFARESSMGFIMSSYNQQSARHHIPVEVQHIRDGQMVSIEYIQESLKGYQVVVSFSDSEYKLKLAFVSLVSNTPIQRSEASSLEIRYISGKT